MSNEGSNSAEFTGDRGQHFMRLYMVIQRRLYGFVLSLAPNATDADDIVQETVSVMWSKFDEFEPGTDFAAWAFCIARYQTLTYRRRKKSQPRQFTDQAIEAIDNISTSKTEHEDARKDALDQCLAKLKDNDRKVLYLRYEVGSTLRNVAERLDQNINTLYSTLSRIHIALLNCIRRTMSKEEAM